MRSMSTPADRPARPGLTASEFLAAVSHYELNPDLSPDASRLEQQLHQGLVRCAGLAARLAHGSLKGQQLPSVYLPLAPEIRAVHDTVRGLQTRLRQARKQSLKTDALAPLAWGETSATFQLARLALRIVDAVWGVGSQLAEDAWIQQVAEQAAAHPDDHVEEENEDYQQGGRGETDSGPCLMGISEESLAEWGSGIDFPAALASAAAASRLRELFGVRFVFPDPAPLLRDARIELMELMELSRAIPVESAAGEHPVVNGAEGGGRYRGLATLASYA